MNVPPSACARVAAVCLVLFFAGELRAQTGIALVRHAPVVNGTIDGSIQQIAAESDTLNGGALITGDWLVPGEPVVRVNGRPMFAGTVDGSGNVAPSNFQITLNGSSSLRHIVRRTDGVLFPVVSSPPQPAGTRSVTVNSRTDSVGSFSTLKALTLNGSVGQFAIPPGSYGDLTANGGSGFTLGVAGAKSPSVYNIQHLTLNSQAQIQVIGPVVLTIANGLSANGDIGATSHPEWLTLQLYSVGLTLNGGASVYAYVITPNGTVTVNGNSVLTGGVVCDRLIINGGGLLRVTAPLLANHTPVASDQSVRLNEDQSVAVALAATDADGDLLQYSIVTPPIHGTLSGQSPAVTYTPQPNYNGTDSFSFEANDGHGDSNVATVTITVVPANDAPTAAPFSVALDEDTPTTVALAATDVDSSSLTYTVTSGMHGALTGTAPNLTYTPALDYNGADSFTYTVSDGQLTSAPATVSLVVRPVDDAPVANNQTASVNEGASVAIQLGATDIDSAASALTFTRTTDPAHGTLTGTAPNFVYTPQPQYGGTDSFAFVASDGQLTSAPAIVTINISANHPPVVGNGSATTAEDSAVGLTLAGTDVDQDALTFAIMAAPQHGALSVLTPAGSLAATVVYTPAKDYNGRDSFTFKANDVKADSNVATYSVVVTAVNDAPVAAEQNVQLDEDTPVTVILSGSDVDSPNLAFRVINSPAHGTLGGIAVGPNNTAFVTYTPAANYNGPDTFTFVANDGELDSMPATVTMTVRAVNDPPVADGQQVQTLEDTALTITLTGSDIDSSDFTLLVNTPPVHGSLSAITVGSDKTATVVYTPAQDFNGADSFSIVANDGDAQSIPATVAITVTALNDAPVAQDGGTLSMLQGTPVDFTLLATDVDHDPLTYVIDTPPTHGALSGITPNLTYTPNPSYRGDDGVIFHATDGQANSNAATVKFHMIAVNHAPAATNGSATFNEDTATTISLVASDFDDDALGYFIVVPPQHGTLGPVVIAADSSVSVLYTPGKDYNGSDAFSFKANDGVLDSNTATVALTVKPVNDAPVGSSTTVTGNEDTVIPITLSATDAENDPLVYTITTLPTHGTMTPSSTTTYAYQPAANFNGTDSFTFKASDGLAESALTTINIVVLPVNDAPVALPGSIAVSTGETAPLHLNAVDVDGDDLVFTVTKGPAHGTLAGTAPDFIYTPTAGYLGADGLDFHVNDGQVDSVDATMTISVESPNSAPVVNAGPDKSVTFVPPSIAARGRIVVNNDEWALTDAGFDASPYAGAFAQNLADYLTGGKKGAKFLADTNVLAGSVDFIYTGQKLAAAMQAAGHSWTTSATMPMTLQNLQQYDAIFLGANSVDNQVLIDYVEGGGSVYVSAGSHWSGADADVEARLWNTFLNHFGLNYNSPYNGIAGTLPVTSDHPLFHGIGSLYFSNGNSVSKLNPDDPYTDLPFIYQGQGLFGTAGSTGTEVFLYGSAIDDGIPAPARLTYHWTQVSGPEQAEFDGPASLTTRARLPGAGTYVFRLTASDGVKSGTDDVVVFANITPRVFAGPDKGIPDTNGVVNLVASCADDGVASGALTYAWRKVGGPGTVTFSDDKALTTTASFSDPGIYSLEISASDGFSTATDVVEVRVGVHDFEAPAGLVAWWPLNWSPYDVVSGSRKLAGGSYVDGKVGGALDLSADHPTAIANAHPDYDLGASPAGFTIEFWIKSGSNTPAVAWAGGFKLLLQDGNRVGGNFRDANGTDHNFDSYLWGGDDVLWANGSAWTQIVVTYDRPTGIARFFQDGRLRHTQSFGSFAVATHGDFQLGSAGFSGQLDEVSLYGRPLTPVEVGAIAAAGTQGKAPPDTNLPPSVYAGPDLYVANAGGSAILNGSVDDDGLPFGAPAVKWSKVSGPGSITFTSDTAAQTGATFSAPGVYLLQLTGDDRYDAAVSDYVEVRVGGGFSKPADGIVAWWPANESPKDVVGGSDAQLLNGTTYGPGMVMTGFQFQTPGNFALIPHHANVDLGASAAGYTIEFWINSTSDQNFLSWSGGASLSLVGGNRFGGNLRDANGTDHVFDTYTLGGGAVMWTNGSPWNHIAIAYDRPTGTVRMYLNGQIMQTANFGSYPLGTTGDLSFGGNSFTGTIDELAFYNRPLTSAEIASGYSAGAAGRAPLDGNMAPLVDAGANLPVKTVGVAVPISATVVDDSRPFGPPTVTWTPVDGPATSSITNAAAAQTTAVFPSAGTYLLRVSASDGAAAVASDLLEVQVGGGYATPPAGIALWWPGNGKAHEVVNGNHDVELVNGATYASGYVSQGFKFNGTGSYGHVVQHSDIDIGNSPAGYTIEFWVSSTSGGNFVSWDNGARLYLVDGNRLGGNLRDTAGTDHVFDTYTLGGDVMWTYTAPWNHIAITYDRPTGAVRMYENGRPMQNVNFGSYALATAGDLYLGSAGFNGVVDELSFYRRPLSPAEVMAIVQADRHGKSAPNANTPPQVNAGSTITLAAPGSASLNGAVADDQLPFGAPDLQWTRVIGPVSPAFVDASAAQTSASFSSPGLYVLRLTANDGYATAVSDAVDVKVGGGFAALPADATAWWPANASPRDVIGGHDIQFAGNVTYDTGEVGQALRFQGSGAYAYAPAHQDLDIGSSAAGYSIEFWVNSTSTGSMLAWNGGAQLYLIDGNRLGGNLRDATGADHVFDTYTLSGPDVLWTYQAPWNHIVIAYDRASGVVRFYGNGQLKRSATVGSGGLATTGDFLLSSGSWSGLLDDVTLYRRPLTDTEVAAIYAAGSLGKSQTVNQAPKVLISAPSSVTANSAASVSGLATDDGLPNPPAALTYQWSKVSGPGGVSFGNPTGAASSAVFDTAGTYVIRLSVSDSALTSSVDATIVAAAPPTSLAPTVAIYAPVNGAKVASGHYVEVDAHASDADGKIAKIEFFDGLAKVGQQTLPAADDATTYFWAFPNGLAIGQHTFTAVATDNSGVHTTSAPVSIEVIADPGPPIAVMTTPTENARLSAPTTVFGQALTPALAQWQLQYRLKAAEGAPAETWVTFASGTNQVGTPASDSTPAADGELGIFDPTSLVNGIYELRLAVTDTSGRTATTDLVDSDADGNTFNAPRPVVVEGNMKVGVFSLAFEDIKVPVAGIPITATRTYDSRDTRVGDFGPGWRLAIANVRVQKNRALGTSWYQTPQSGTGIQFYNVDPLGDRIVTVTMPDGETHRFKIGAVVKNREGDPDDASFAALVTQGTLKFYPLGDTTSTLEPLDNNNHLADHFFIYGTDEQDLMTATLGDDAAVTVNATRFRLTTKDGSVYLLDETLGLLSITDLNGNTLVVNRDGQNRVRSVVSTLNTTPAVVTSLVVHRDTTGRVDYIRDPAGHNVDYGYDNQGRLSSFTDRELNVTAFFYENAKFPYYLTRVVDPRGVDAIRTEFDDNGKMIRQTDATGNVTTFTHNMDPAARSEKVKDRLGNETTFFYDDRGNVTLKIDPLGAQTNYSYYPDSDRVKFETDHYGNAKSMAYDARGNVVTETVGASVSEDPANPATGHTTRTSYNDQSAPTQIVDADGRTQTFTYDPTTNSLLTQTAGAGGSAPATTTFTYNVDETLSTQTDAVGNVTGYTYEYGYSDPAYPGAVKRVITTVTDPAGTLGSDPANSSDTVLRATSTLYDAQENQLAQIVTRHLPDASTQDVVTKYLYDDENRPVATIQPDGRVSETRFNAIGKTDESVEWQTLADYEAQDQSKARVTSYRYDDRGNQTAVTYPDGTFELTHFDAENRKDWSQDRRGYRIFFVYDAAGRLVSTIYPDSDDDLGDAAPSAVTDGRLVDNPKTTTTYDLVGRVTDTYDETGVHNQTVYYANGTADAGRRKQTVQVHAGGNQTTQYQYDGAGNVRFVTDPRGNTVETQYDEQGRPTLVKYPATDENPATQTETRYDALGRRAAVIDQEGKFARYRYDALGRLVQVRQYLNPGLAATDAAFLLSATNAGVVATFYTYDELGNQQTQTDALGRTTTFWTDVTGRRTKRILPATSDASAAFETLTYDGWGNLRQRKDFNGKSTTFLYDALNRLITKTADSTHPSLVYTNAIARIEYDYDENGARKAARAYNASNTLLYTESTPHDERSRIAYKDSTNGRLDYSYYANNRLKDVVSANATGVNVGYRYDDLNRLQHVDDATTGATLSSDYSYNANGSLESLTQPNGIVHTYTYDTLNRLRTLQVKVGAAVLGGSSIGTLLHDYNYTLNPSGHRHSVTEGARTTTYTYDALYRLTNESIVGDTHGNSGSIGYTLDKVGNRLSRNSQLATITSQPTQSYDARDRLTTDTYDNNGNTVVGRTVLGEPPGADVYDFENRLIVRTKADGSTINIVYDADGNRIAKNILNPSAQTVSSTTWLVDTNNLTGYAQVVEERTVTASTNTTSLYSYGTQLVSRTDVDTRYSLPAARYYTVDGHGNVRELTDSTGTITDRYDYDAFGDLIAISGSSANNYLYCGEQFDADLGLYYNRARYLNTDSGRFWSMDDYEGSSAQPVSLSKYLYCSAEPIGATDPTGNFSLLEESAVGDVIGTMNRIVIPTLRFVNTAKKLADIWYLVQGVAKIIETGSIKSSIDDALREGRRFVRGVTLDAIVQDLEANLPEIFTRSVATWGSFIVEHISKIEAFDVYLPHIGIPFPPAEIPVGLKVPGTDKPVRIVLGNSGNRAGRVTGAGIHFSDVGLKQIWRMDFHPIHSNEGNDPNSWRSDMFQYHVNSP